MTFVFEFLLSFCLIFFFSSRSFAYRCSCVSTGTLVFTRFRALFDFGDGEGEEEDGKLMLKFSVEDFCGVVDSSDVRIEFSSEFGRSCGFLYS